MEGVKGLDAGGGDLGGGGGAVEDWGLGGGEEEGAEVVDVGDRDEGWGGEGGHCVWSWRGGGKFKFGSPHVVELFWILYRSRSLP